MADNKKVTWGNNSRVKMIPDSTRDRLNELWGTPEYSGKMGKIDNVSAWTALHDLWERKDDRLSFFISGVAWRLLNKDEKGKDSDVVYGFDFAELDDLEAVPGQTLQQIYAYSIGIFIGEMRILSHPGMLAEARTYDGNRFTSHPLTLHRDVLFTPPQKEGEKMEPVIISLDTLDPVTVVWPGPGICEATLKQQRIDRAEKNQRRFTVRYRPIPTGLPALDRLLGGGIQPSRLTILAGVSGIGKSSLLSQIVTNVPDARYLVTREQIIDVLDRIRIQGGQLEDPEATLFHADDLGYGFIGERPSPALICNCLRDDICSGGLLIIDGGEYMRDSDCKLTTHFAIEEAFKELSLIAHNREMAIVATLPTNALSPFDVPTVASVSPRKATEYAQQVLCLFRDEGRYIVRLIKNSVGVTGDMVANFDRSTLRWDVELSEAQIEEEAAANSKQIIGELVSKYGGKVPRSLFKKESKKVNK